MSDALFLLLEDSLIIGVITAAIVIVAVMLERKEDREAKWSQARIPRAKSA